MFRHVVLFRWREDAAASDIDAGLTAAEALLARLPGVVSAHVGRDAGLTEGNFDACIVADYDDEAAYVAYRDHPDHVALVKEQLAPMLADRAAMQHELPHGA